MAYSDGCGVCGQAFVSGVNVTSGGYNDGNPTFRHANCQAKEVYAHPAFLCGPPVEDPNGEIAYDCAEDTTLNAVGH